MCVFERHVIVVELATARTVSRVRAKADAPATVPK
jgi:hypothetical protein